MAWVRGYVSSSSVRRLVAALVVFAALLVAPDAAAHVIGLSTGEYTARGASVTGTLSLARAELASLAPALDANFDGHLTAAEVHRGRELLRDKIVARILVTSGGAPCAPTLTDAALTEEDGALVSGRWDCPSASDPFEMEFAVLDDLARGHRHIARVVSEDGTRDQVLESSRRSLSIAPAAAHADGERAPAGRGSSAPAFFVMGVEHILLGYDHLVFLVGLVLVRSRRMALVGVVTAFTIAHSLTLGLAVLDVWSPSPRVIEPAIGLSIAYIGVENFFLEDTAKRWRIAFAFGLLHGFGFAGALQEVALPRDAIPAALFAFNVGVEAGQLAVLALLLPLVAFLRRERWFEPLGVRVASGAIALAGGLWFVARVVE